MNKKGYGEWIFFGMMIGVLLWIGFSQLLGPVTDATSDARSINGLDCDNSSISQGTKATCIITDWMVFGWSGAVITGIIGAASGGLIGKLIEK